jgi:Xaa-Pro aminopeptidase
MLDRTAAHGLAHATVNRTTPGAEPCLVEREVRVRRRVRATLLYGDTYSSADLRHEVPIGIPDPFLLVEQDGKTHVVINGGEVPRLEHLGHLAVHSFDEFRPGEASAKGLTSPEMHAALLRRAIAGIGVRAAIVPPTFPVFLADLLRSDGVTLTVDSDHFADRRRTKTEAEMTGIGRAQRAAEAGLDAARNLLRRANSVKDGSLEVDGEALTSERVKVAIKQALIARSASADDIIVSHGAQAAVSHHMGSGQLMADELIVIDIWPRDDSSGCHADITRTYVVGVPSPLAVRWHEDVRRALKAALATVRAGVPATLPFDAACDTLEAAGYQTLRDRVPGVPVHSGFTHALGHGVGLEAHESPSLYSSSDEALRAGDVITLEPGLYDPEVGGLRLEDLVLVTADGAEVFTQYPYELAP